MQRLRYSKYLQTFALLLDIFVLASVFFIFFAHHRLPFKETSRIIWEQSYLPILLLSLFWLLLSGWSKIYHVPRNLTFTIYLERLLTHMVFFIFGIILLGKVSNNEFMKVEKFWLCAVLFTIMLLLKSGIFFIIKYLRSLGINYRNAMFIGRSDSLEILKKTLQSRKDYGYRFFDYQNGQPNAKDITEFWNENGIHTVFMQLGNEELCREQTEKIIQQAEINKIRMVLIPNFGQNEFFDYDLTYIQAQPVLTPAKFPLDFSSNYLLKRGFDVFFSLLFIIFIGSWLFPIVSLVVLLESKGPPFFLQKRYGRNDEIFRCIKFRSMVVNDGSSVRTTAENDDRITNFGRFLRKTNMDETPQFLNVLKGDMSIVGPRPHMLVVDDFYKPKISKYSARNRVKPGITGLAQVNGLRGDSGNMEVEMKKRIMADYFYVKNWSLSLDLIIILKTIFLIISGDKKAK